MPPLTKDVIKFGTFTVTSQVFHLSPLSFALVNLKPLLPGHVLVSPRRVVPRFNDLTQSEVQDLFLTVQRVSRTVERVFKATSLNIAIQDGADAGQSVPHVHAHIIPRRKDDLPETDAIYGMMENEEGDLGKQFVQRDKEVRESKEQEVDGDIPDGEQARGRFPAVDADESRKPRSKDEMKKEAEWLAREMVEDTKGES
ncbi:HIT-like domain-containing protein [Lophiotrema nucula]|uniref:Bis(5'-adenosyl)-triphosphatase n=1 Tax=Lophiotrema nucula TaxID=690887 RepID=A0A6A5YFE7_9PLEO|nr:HIT-like domain-containing protein [Lophiotrema nucula]